MADYNETERELLRQAKEMRDLYESRPWKVYASIIESQIKTREELILNSPAGTMSEGELEQIKGARLGLKLALDNLSAIIETGSAIVASHQGDSDGENE